MKKFILLFFAAFSLFSCQDDADFITDKGGGGQTNATKIDSLEIYKNQTDQSVMLSNLIRYQDGKYVLDLSEKDAEALGIDMELYHEFLKRVDNINNLDNK